MSNNDYLFTILTTGDSYVGKSSILNYFFDKRFYNNLVLTIGIDYKSKEIRIDEKIVILFIVRINIIIFLIYT